MSNRLFSIMASALSDDPREAARRARGAGFSGIVFDVLDSRFDFLGLSTSGRREFRHMLENEHQQLVAIRCDLDAKGFAPGTDVDRALTRLDRALELSVGLGAGCVCVDLGPLPPAPVVQRPKPTVTPAQAGLIILPSPAPAAPVEPQAPAAPPDERFIAQVNSALGELCARADRYRVPLALSSSLSSLASLHHALKAIACPWFGIEVDPSAILRDAWELDEVFSNIGALLRHVRARDAALGADHRTRPAIIGQGSVEWRRLLDALDESGYTGTITIDPTELTDRATAALAGKRFLESL